MKVTLQYDAMDCGPSCLSMISNYYGKNYPLQYLRDECFITREGVSLLGISQAANKIGLNYISAKLPLEALVELDVPCILHWNQNHFVVLKPMKRKRWQPKSKKRKWRILDPSYGPISLSDEKFLEHWIQGDGQGVALFLEPSEEFYEKEVPQKQKISYKYLLKYLSEYRKEVFKLFALLLLGSFLTLIFPFLSQALIDNGVLARDLSYIKLILFAQLALFFGTIAIQIIRNWIMLYVGTKLSIQIISEFLTKILQLPIGFFESKMKGDINQRINDNERIERLLTSQSLLTVFSIITFSVFFGVLLYYDLGIFVTYFILTVLSILWSYYFLKKRRILDYHKFQAEALNQDSIYEMLNGVTEMKLNDFSDYKLKEWKKHQDNLFKINTRILKLDQYQVSGFEFLNQSKNIVVTFIAAKLVVDGAMTLGMLLSISYIIGQMNSPVTQLISFFRSLQDAKMSMERMTEVQNLSPEESEGTIDPAQQDDNQNSSIGEPAFSFKDVSFQYEGYKSPYILHDLNMEIPKGKVTAIVGTSGSGKTTILKLLLKFYKPTKGDLSMNDINLANISPNGLRKQCGVVMQDGFIFADSIERNIATGDTDIDYERLNKAIQMANLTDFISSLPLNVKTKIGESGNGISGGQKQRILIARAVYKDPNFIFLDEATSALDAENEKIIHDNLQEFFEGKTVIIIAHRLSTVKQADQIVVLKKGKIVEVGTHQQLVKNKAAYFNLVKNQLELGN